MILTVENIEEWKQCLTKEMKFQYNIDNFADCHTNKYWLYNHYGEDTQDVINEEVENWDEKIES